jgi:8-oxo-dGTP diphosphatase
MSAPLRPVVAVRVIVTDAHSRILLVQRAGSAHAAGSWCLPGGKVDYCEAPETAAAREVKEETNLDLRDMRFLFYQNSPPIAEGKMHCINLYFEAKTDGGVTLNPEASAFAWLSIDEAIAQKPVFGAIEALGWYKSRA